MPTRSTGTGTGERLHDTPPITPRIASSNLTLIAGLLLTGFTILKIMAVAHFDTTSALIIVNSSGAGTVVIGAMTVLLPAVVYVGFFLSVVAADDTIERNVLYVLSGLTGLIVLLTWNILIALLTLVVGGLILGASPLNILWKKIQPTFLEEPDEMRTRRESLRAESAEIERGVKVVEKISEDRLRRFTEAIAEYDAAINRWWDQIERARHRTKRFLVGVVVWTFIITLPGVLSDTPWLPKERLGRGTEVIVGYVLAVDESSLLLLREQDRIVLRLSSTGWSREYCEASSSPYGGSLLAFAYKGTALYTSCP